MSEHEFQEWMVLSQIEPIGDERGDYHAAKIAACSGFAKGKIDTKPFAIKAERTHKDIVAKGREIQAIVQAGLRRK